MRNEVKEYQTIEYSIKREIQGIGGRSLVGVFEEQQEDQFSSLRTEWEQIRVLGNKPGEVVKDKSVETLQKFGIYSKYDYNAWKLSHGIDKTSFTFEKDHSV